MTGMISRVFLPLALPIANGLAQTPQGPDVVIRSSAREELLEVVVRDAHGKLVTNLKPDEIAIYEDGVRQDVRSLRLVASKEVRVEDEKQAAEARAWLVDSGQPHGLQEILAIVGKRKYRAETAGIQAEDPDVSVGAKFAVHELARRLEGESARIGIQIVQDQADHIHGAQWIK